MFPAPRIKPRTTLRATRLAPHIFANAQLHTACPAKNRSRIPLASRPHLNRMPRQLDMTVLASVIDSAAPHLDRNDVRSSVKIPATRPRTPTPPAHLW